MKKHEKIEAHVRQMKFNAKKGIQGLDENAEEYVRNKFFYETLILAYDGILIHIKHEL